RVAAVRGRVARGRAVGALVLVAVGEIDPGPGSLGDGPGRGKAGSEAVRVEDREEVGGPPAHRVAGDVGAIRVDGKRPVHVVPHLAEVDLAAPDVPRRR